MYKIIGSDQKEYGPVGAEELRQWIREGRANAQSRIRAEGSADWQPLQSFPEFAALFAAGPPVMPPPFSTPQQVEVTVRKTNGFAIAGFVFSLLGIPCCGCGIFPILGLIFSGLGLSQTFSNPRQGGRGLAIAGLIISLLVLFWTGVGLVLFLHNAN